jgi:hypothetical protein
MHIGLLGGQGVMLLPSGGAQPIQQLLTANQANVEALFLLFEVVVLSVILRICRINHVKPQHIGHILPRPQ